MCTCPVGRNQSRNDSPRHYDGGSLVKNTFKNQILPAVDRETWRSRNANMIQNHSGDRHSTYPVPSPPITQSELAPAPAVPRNTLTASKDGGHRFESSRKEVSQQQQRREKLDKQLPFDATLKDDTNKVASPSVHKDSTARTNRDESTKKRRHDKSPADTDSKILPGSPSLEPNPKRFHESIYKHGRSRRRHQRASDKQLTTTRSTRPPVLQTSNAFHKSPDSPAAVTRNLREEKTNEYRRKRRQRRRRRRRRENASKSIESRSPSSKTIGRI